MDISDFDFQLPDNLIAQKPLAERDAARMLIVERADHTWRDSYFRDLPARLSPGDVLVINNTRVFPARLRGKRVPFGGAVELLLAREVERNSWEALARPARKLNPGDGLHITDGLRGKICARPARIMGSNSLSLNPGCAPITQP